MDIIIYTTHCPRCNVLKKKLEQKGLVFTEVDDMNEMAKLGLRSVPYLSVDGGDPMDFVMAVNWLNSQEG